MYKFKLLSLKNVKTPPFFPLSKNHWNRWIEDMDSQHRCEEYYIFTIICCFKTEYTLKHAPTEKQLKKKGKNKLNIRLWCVYSTYIWLSWPSFLSSFAASDNLSAKLAQFSQLHEWALCRNTGCLSSVFIPICRNYLSYTVPQLPQVLPVSFRESYSKPTYSNILLSQNRWECLS